MHVIMTPDGLKLLANVIARDNKQSTKNMEYHAAIATEICLVICYTS